MSDRRTDASRESILLVDDAPANPAQETRDALLAAIRAFSGEALQSDDIAVMVLFRGS